jgi:predicted PurR-regulated permease PerM
MKSRNKDHLTISVDSGTIIRAIVIVLGALLVLAFIEAISRALIIIFISLFLALALNPAVGWIARKLKSKSRVRATGTAYLMVLLFLVGFFALVIPPLVNQTADFIKDVPGTIQEFKEDDSTVSRLVYQYDLEAQVDRFASDFSSRFQDIGQPVLTTAGAVGTAVASAIAVLVLTFMMLVEGPKLLDKFFAIQPKSKRAERKKLAHRMYKTVTGYVNGQLILALLAGTFAFIALMIGSSVFDASVNEVALAAIVALFALLPLIGTTIGAVIVVIACLFVSTPLAISIAVFFIIYQQIENITIQPYIQARTNRLTPLIVFTAALVGVTFAGVLGALVAVPVAACIKILLEEHYKKRLSRAEKV